MSSGAVAAAGGTVSQRGAPVTAGRPGVHRSARLPLLPGHSGRAPLPDTRGGRGAVHQPLIVPGERRRARRARRARRGSVGRGGAQWDTVGRGGVPGLRGPPAVPPPIVADAAGSRSGRPAALDGGPVGLGSLSECRPAAATACHRRVTSVSVPCQCRVTQTGCSGGDGETVIRWRLITPSVICPAPAPAPAAAPALGAGPPHPATTQLDHARPAVIV